MGFLSEVYMARIRTIKPEFWTDERIVQLPFHTRLLFIGLWNFCDDQGCITDSPEKIRLQVLPADREVDIEECLDLLVSCGLLEILINEEGLRAFHVANWSKHQKIDNPAKPKILDGTYRKMAIPSEDRRGLAKKYGCLPGNSGSAECYFCGSPGMVHWHKLSSGRPSSWVSFSGLEIDHLVPESKGGASASENLVLSCRSCNRGRNNKDHIDFIFSGKAESQQFLAIPSYSSPLEGKGREGKGKDVSSSIAPTDDEYFASLAEQEQKRQAEADARVKVEMTSDWQPDLKVLDDHLKFMGTKVLVSGRKVTSADLTDEITSDFRSAGHRKQERRTNHDWHGGLANYLIARIKNPKPETPKNSLPGGQNGTGEPPRHRLAFTDEKDRPKYGTYALMKPEPVKIANDPNDPVWIARKAELWSYLK